ncbi:MAG: penicillin-binding protein [Clostridia bacterium]|nr:penicillin-binding protein [Clostridia bacterium]
MKKITSRTIICLLLALVLLGGLGFFTFNFVRDGADWAMFPSNRHLYNKDGNLKAGRVLDCNGKVLCESGEDGWKYYQGNSDIRKATLHTVGLPDGAIASGAITRFADKLCGYNIVTGAESILPLGRDLHMTIDADVCATAYKALGSHRGCVGVYNYVTGEVICMVSTPTFDPANPPNIAEGDSRYDGVYINRLLSAKFAPGSTFKLLTAAAALENIENVQERTYECTGNRKIGDMVITCPHNHGTEDFERALNQSCNCYFGQLAAELGSDIMNDYVKKAGLTESYSVSGINTKPSTFNFDTDDGALAWSGIGQGEDLVNPCALMVYMGAIGRGGYAAVPQLVEYTSFTDSYMTSFYFVHNTGRMIQESTAAVMQQLMRSNVVNYYGTGNFPGLNICAKSGTAQLDSQQTENAWFAGFLQDEDHPYAFVVLVEEGGSGKDAAGSVANKVLQAAVKD